MVDVIVPWTLTVQNDGSGKLKITFMGLGEEVSNDVPALFRKLASMTELMEVDLQFTPQTETKTSINKLKNKASDYLNSLIKQ